MDKEKITRIALSAAVFAGVVIVMCFVARIMMLNSKAPLPTAYEQALDKLAGNKTDETDSSSEADKLASEDLDADATASDNIEAAGGDDAATAIPGSEDLTAETGAETAGPMEEADGADETTTADGSTDTTRTGHVIAINPDHQKQANTDKEPIGPNAAESKIKMSWGASGVVSGVPEYKLNLEVAQLLKTELEARGYTVYMVRETEDVQLSESERALLANANAELVLHIHSNSDERPEIAGLMAFYPSEDNRFVGGLSAACKRLSSAIVDGMAAKTGAKSWGPIANNSLTALNWTTIPASHVEIGYLSNEAEDKLLQTQDYRKLLVLGIADGLDSYFAQ